MLSYDLWVAEVVAVAAAVAILLVNVVLSRLEEWSQRNRTTHELLSASFRETATLGLVALILFIIEQTHAVDKEGINTELALLHISVWSVAIAYALWTAVLAFLSARLGHRWKAVEEHYSCNFDAYRALKQRCAALQSQLGVAPDPVGAATAADSHVLATLLSACRHPQLWSTYLRDLHDIRYVELRERFIAHHGLSHDFPFNKYLHQAKLHLFVRLANIPTSLWACIAVVMGLDLYVRSIWPAYAAGVEAVELVCIVAGLMVLLSSAVYIKTRAVAFVIFRSEYAEAQVESPLLRQAEDWSEIRTQMSYRTFGRAGGGQGSPGVAATAAEASGSGGGGRSGLPAPPDAVGRGISLRLQSGRLDDAATHRQMQRALLLRHRQLFWFKQPRFLLRLLQFVLFLGALGVALLVVFWSNVTAGVAQVLFAFGSLAAATIFSFAVLRAVVPLYSLSLHISGLVDVRLLAMAVLAHEEAKQQTLTVLAGRPPSSSSSSSSASPGGDTWKRRWARCCSAAASADSRISSSSSISSRRWLAAHAWRARARTLGVALNSVAGYTAALTLTAVAFLLSAMVAAGFIEGVDRTIMFAFVAALTAVIASDWGLRTWAGGGLGLRLLVHRHTSDAGAAPVPAEPVSAFAMGALPFTVRQTAARCADALAVCAAVVGVVLLAALGGFAPTPDGAGEVVAGGPASAPIYILAPAFLVHLSCLAMQQVASYSGVVVPPRRRHPHPALPLAAAGEAPPDRSARARAPQQLPPAPLSTSQEDQQQQQQQPLRGAEARLIRLIAEDAASARALVGPPPWYRGQAPHGIRASVVEDEPLLEALIQPPPLARQASAPAAPLPTAPARVPPPRLLPRRSLPARWGTGAGSPADAEAEPAQPPGVQAETAGVLQDLEAAHVHAEDAALEAVIEEEAEGGPTPPAQAASPGAAAAAVLAAAHAPSLSDHLSVYGFGQRPAPRVGELSVSDAPAAAAAYLAGAGGGAEGEAASQPQTMHPTLVAALHGIARGHLRSMLQAPDEAWEVAVARLAPSPVSPGAGSSPTASQTGAAQPQPQSDKQH